MKYSVVIVLILAVKVSHAQTMYMDSIFTEVNKTTYTYDNSKSEALQFDYYIAGNAREEIPLLVYVHGGGFVGGTRDSKDLVNFATKLAQRGYAVASVSYRLSMRGIGFGCDVAAKKKIAAIDSASYDVGLAIKYIVDNNREFNIDRNKIVLMGSSA